MNKHKAFSPGKEPINIKVANSSYHAQQAVSDSLLLACQRGDKTKVDEWMKRAEAGEIIKIM